jgi:hypothetical protein
MLAHIQKSQAMVGLALVMDARQAVEALPLVLLGRIQIGALVAAARKAGASSHLPHLDAQAAPLI